MTKISPDNTATTVEAKIYTLDILYFSSKWAVGGREGGSVQNKKKIKIQSEEENNYYSKADNESENREKLAGYHDRHKKNMNIYFERVLLCLFNKYNNCDNLAK